MYTRDFLHLYQGILWEICSHISLKKKFLLNNEYRTFCWANQYDVDPICEKFAGMPESKMDLF